MSTQKNYFCWYHWLSANPNIQLYISWLAAATFDLFLRCVVYYLDYKRESSVSSGVRDVTLVTNTCSQSAECLYATVCNQTWYCGAPPWARMSCEKTGNLSSRSRSQCGFILYNQNMMVSAISFINFKLMSLLMQPNSLWWKIIINKEVFSENIGLLCSRSRLNISINVSLYCISWLAEPFVTKPSMVTHH